jgi:hypothetical protein
MSTFDGKIKILADNQLRVVSATTTNGTAQNKGTATDLLLTINVGADGASAFAAGTTAAPVIQGSNVSSFASPTTVVADKGTLPAQFAAVGQTNLHFGNLQFQFYRISVVSTGSPVMNLTCVWNFHPVQDSFDASVQ